MTKRAPTRLYDTLEWTPEERALARQFHTQFFRAWNAHPRHWLGTRIVKYPTDLFLYQMLISDLKPDVVIETGAFMGGGALFFASMCELVGHGQVLSIDRREMRGRPQHPRLTYLIGRSTAVDTMARVHDFTAGKTVMAVLDSDHRSSHVKRELVHYGALVTTGQFLVCEDTMLGGEPIAWKYGVDGPSKAVRWFLERHPEFEVVPKEDQFLISMSPGGWLRKRG